MLSFLRKLSTDNGFSSYFLDSLPKAKRYFKTFYFILATDSFVT